MTRQSSVADLWRSVDEMQIDDDKTEAGQETLHGNAGNSGNSHEQTGYKQPDTSPTTSSNDPDYRQGMCRVPFVPDSGNGRTATPGLSSSRHAGNHGQWHYTNPMTSLGRPASQQAGANGQGGNIILPPSHPRASAASRQAPGPTLDHHWNNFSTRPSDPTSTSGPGPTPQWIAAASGFVTGPTIAGPSAPPPPVCIPEIQRQIVEDGLGRQRPYIGTYQDDDDWREAARDTTQYRHGPAMSNWRR